MTASGPAAAPALLACCTGIVAGAAIAFLRLGGGYTGLGVQDVRAYRGVAVEDSVALAGGRTMHRLALASVSSGGEAASARAAGTVRIFAAGGAASSMGQEVTVRGRLEPAPPWKSDDFLSRVGASDLRVGGIGFPPFRLRQQLLSTLDERIRQIGYPVSAFFLAMFLGDRGGITDELAERFRDAGALHVLALSGTHLVFVYGLAALLARALPFARARFAVPFATAAAYLFLVGPLPSLVRAAGMLVVAVAARQADRPSSGLDLLGLAGSFVLLLEPRMLFDVSFQLSFCAVLGMVTLGAAVADRLERVVPRALALPIAGAAGAQIAVAPILLGVYGAFQPIGLVSGLFIAPCATALLAGGLLDVALPLWLPAPIHGVIGSALYASYRVLEYLLQFFSRFPASRSWAFVLAMGAGVAALLLPRAVLRRVRGH